MFCTYIVRIHFNTMHPPFANNLWFTWFNSSGIGIENCRFNLILLIPKLCKQYLIDVIGAVHNLIGNDLCPSKKHNILSNKSNDRYVQNMIYWIS